MKKRYWIPAVLITIVALTYFLGPPPPKPVYTIDVPEVPKTPHELERFVAEKEAEWPLREDNEARIVWADSSKTKSKYAFVYLHGFAGSYQDGYPWNVRLADTFNANIYLSRYAGHGLKPPASLLVFTPETAWLDAQEALAIGEAIGDKVILLSTSTGGTLATLLAAKFPDRVHAILNIGPNYQDDIPGTWMLNSNWGYELSHLISLGQYREVSHDKPIADQYWDTMYTAEALMELQVLVSSVTKDSIISKVSCPALTMYYHKDAFNEDERVEISVYSDLHAKFKTPQDKVRLVALSTPKTHFCGSEIMSEDVEITLETAIAFCREVLSL